MAGFVDVAVSWAVVAGGSTVVGETEGSSPRSVVCGTIVAGGAVVAGAGGEGDAESGDVAGE